MGTFITISSPAVRLRRLPQLALNAISNRQDLHSLPRQTLKHNQVIDIATRFGVISTSKPTTSTDSAPLLTAASRQKAIDFKSSQQPLVDVQSPRIAINPRPILSVLDVAPIENVKKSGYPGFDLITRLAKHLISPSQALDNVVTFVKLKWALSGPYGFGSRFGDRSTLQKMLGLSPSVFVRPRDAIIVAIDTEFIQHQGSQYVTEIGVTTLDTRSLINVSPGEYASSWMSKAETHHWIVDDVPVDYKPVSPCLFSGSVSGTSSKVQQQLLRLLRQLSNGGARKLVLLGHALRHDLNALKICPAFGLSIAECRHRGYKLGRFFDTEKLLREAKVESSQYIPGKLGKLGRRIGISRKFWSGTGTLEGVHNAGNDAMYTMMTLLLFATRWESILAEAQAFGAMREQGRVRFNAYRRRQRHKSDRASFAALPEDVREDVQKSDMS